MSLVQFLRILLARRWTIIVATLACFIVATGVAMVLPKRYQATARVLLDIVKPDPVTGLSVGGRDARSYIRTQVELITDMRVAGVVVDSLGLAGDPDTIAAFASTGGNPNDPAAVRRYVGQQIINNTSANLVDGSNIMEISYEGSNPALAKRVVELVRQAYIDSSLRFKTDAAGRNGDWYREQAAKAQRLLASAEAAKTDFMRRNNIVMQGGIEVEQQRLSNLSSVLVSARSGVGASEAGASARLTNDPVADQLRVQVAQIDSAIADAGSRLGTAHPQYKALQNQRATLQRQLSQAVSQSRAGVSQQLSITRRSVADLEREYEAQRQKVLSMKPVLDQLDQLQREVELRTAQYQQAAQRAGQLRLEADVSETGLVILGDATAATKPTWPNIPLISALAAIFGLGLGIVVALLSEFLARRVRGAEDLAYAAGAPVFAVVSAGEQRSWRDNVRRLLSRGGNDTDLVPAE